MTSPKAEPSASTELALSFEVTLDDLVDFTVAQLEKSERYVKVQRTLRIAFSVTLGLIVVVFGLLLDQRIAAAFGLPFGLFYYYRYPRSARNTLRRHAYRVYRGAETDAGVGPQTLRLDGQVLEHTAGTNHARIPIWSIEDIVMGPAIQIVLGPNAGIVVPKGRVTAGDVDRFVSELRGRRPSDSPSP